MSNKKKIAYKLITPKWWNPIFWIVIIVISPFFLFFEGWKEFREELTSVIKEAFTK
ncbi:MAG: hypothetical protein ACI9J3_003293 [Parvicellaceae bacterium]|jgi:hypothetical protein